MTKKNELKVLSSDLSLVKNQNDLVKLLKTENGAKSILEEAQLEYSELVQKQDVTTDKGRKAISANATKMVTLKTTVVGITKDRYLDPINAEKRVVTDNRNKLEAGLDALRDKIKKPLIEYREKQAKFVAWAEAEIERIKEYGKNHLNGQLVSMQTLELHHQDLAEYVVDSEVFKEFTGEAIETLEESVKSNEQHIETEQKRLNEAAELERLRKQNEANALKLKQLEDEKAEREQKRIDSHNDSITMLKILGSDLDVNNKPIELNKLEANLIILESSNSFEHFEEFEDEARKVYLQSHERLTNSIEKLKNAEKDDLNASEAIETDSSVNDADETEKPHVSVISNPFTGVSKHPIPEIDVIGNASPIFVPSKEPEDSLSEPFTETENNKQLILNVIHDLVGELFYYGRKEDEDLPLNAIEESVSEGVITVDEINDCFKYHVNEYLND